MQTSHGTKLLLPWKEKRDLSVKRRKLINLKIKNGIGMSDYNIHKNLRTI